MGVAAAERVFCAVLLRDGFPVLAAASWPLVRLVASPEGVDDASDRVDDRSRVTVAADQDHVAGRAVELTRDGLHGVNGDVGEVSQLLAHGRTQGFAAHEVSIAALNGHGVRRSLFGDSQNQAHPTLS